MSSSRFDRNQPNKRQVAKVRLTKKIQVTKFSMQLVYASIAMLALIFPFIPDSDIPTSVIVLPVVLIGWGLSVKKWKTFFKRFKWGDWLTVIPLVTWGYFLIQAGELNIVPAIVSGVVIYLFFLNTIKQKDMPALGFIAMHLILLRVILGVGYAPLETDVFYPLVALAIGLAGMTERSNRQILWWVIPSIGASYFIYQSIPEAATILILIGVIFVTTAELIISLQQKRKNTPKLLLFLGLTLVLDVYVFGSLISANSTGNAANGLIGAQELFAIYAGLLAFALFPQIISILGTFIKGIESTEFNLVSSYLLGYIVFFSLLFDVLTQPSIIPFSDIPWFIHYVLMVVVGLSIAIVLVFLVFDDDFTDNAKFVGLGVFLLSIILLLVLIFAIPILEFILDSSVGVSSLMVWVWIFVLSFVPMYLSISAGWLTLQMILTVIILLPGTSMITETDVILIQFAILLTISLWRVKRSWFIGMGSALVMLLVLNLWAPLPPDYWLSWEKSSILLLFVLLWVEQSSIPRSISLIPKNR